MENDPRDEQFGPDDIDAIRKRAENIYQNEPPWRVYRDLDVLLLMHDDAQKEAGRRYDLAYKLENRIGVLRRTLERAHNCATVRNDGTCDGCFVADALAGPGVPFAHHLEETT